MITDSLRLIGTAWHAARTTLQPWMIGVAPTVAACALITSSVSPVAAVDRFTHSGLQVHARASGIDLELAIPSAVFPRRALVAATVHIENVSGHSRLRVLDPIVHVLSVNGSEVYEAVQGGAPRLFSAVPGVRPTGGALAWSTLRPGEAIVRHVFIVLRAARIEATTAVARGPTAQVSPTATARLTTPLMRISLRHGTPPRITFSRQGFAIRAAIRPGWPEQRGQPWYVDIATCGQTTTGATDWSPVSVLQGGAYHIRAGCFGRTMQWHVAIAWLDKPVGIAEFTSMPRG